jgi:hypothetical protein
MKTKILITIAALALAACAEPARVGDMISSNSIPIASVPEKLRNNVTVETVAGGKKTNPAMYTEIDNDSFKLALETSLVKSGISAGNGVGEYKVNATISVPNPKGMYGLISTSTVEYEITGPNLNEKISVIAKGEAEYSKAFLAVERWRITHERSVKANIESFISKLIEMFNRI